MLKLVKWIFQRFIWQYLRPNFVTTLMPSEDENLKSSNNHIDLPNELVKRKRHIVHNAVSSVIKVVYSIQGFFSAGISGISLVSCSTGTH
jgi:hypothetical protein